MHRLVATHLLNHLRSAVAATGFTVAAAVAFVTAVNFQGTSAEAKTPGKTYCFNRVCHRVLTLAETRRLVGRKTSVVASYYSDCRVDRFNPCGLTSSGTKFRPSKADNAASPIYPNGTKILVWNPANKRAAVVRIDNAGPYWRNRKLDLSAAAANKLGFRRRGVARLMVQVLKAPTRREARYRRHRKYAPVAGYIGRFPTMASALSRAGGPITIQRRRIASANVVLPVQNTFIDERRRWLAQFSEPRPVTVAEATTPSIRLPVRLIRPNLAPNRTRQRARTIRRLAALALKRERAKAAKSKRPRRLRNKTAKKKSIKERRQDAKITRAKQAKSAAPKTARKIPVKAKQKAVKKPVTTQAAQANPVIAKAPVEPKPNMSWRQRLLGINRSGA